MFQFVIAQALEAMLALLESTRNNRGNRGIQTPDQDNPGSRKILRSAAIARSSKAGSGATKTIPSSSTKVAPKTSVSEVFSGCLDILEGPEGERVLWGAFGIVSLGILTVLMFRSCSHVFEVSLRDPGSL